MQGLVIEEDTIFGSNFIVLLLGSTKISGKCTPEFKSCNFGTP